MPPDQVPRRQILLGVAVAVLIFAVLATVVGVDEVLAVLGSAAPRYLAAVVVVGLGWLLLWGMSLHTILRSLDVPVTRLRSVAAYGSIVFANNVTPFAQAGGGAVAAFVVSRSTRTDYETAFAAVTGVDTLNVLPSVLFLFVGVTSVTIQTTLSGRVEGAMWAVVGVGGGIVVLGYLAWRRRHRISDRIAGPLAVVLSGVARLLPGVGAPSRASIRERTDRFVGAIDRLGANQQAVGTVLVLSTAGWVFLVSSLWISLAAVGTHVSVGVVMFAVPASLFAAIIPSPGGAGGIEAALVLVLAAITGVPVATLTAAVLIHRAGTYLLPIVLGGVAMAGLQTVGRKPSIES